MSAPSSRFLIAVVIGLAALCALALWLRFSRATSRPGGATNLIPQINPEVLAQFSALEANEKQANETVWAKEMLAEDCGHVFENLWDDLNQATNKLALLATWPISEIIPPKPGPPRIVVHDIELREPDGSISAWNAKQWRQFLTETETAGWQLVQTEFRHVRFDTDPSGKPLQSHFYYSAHLTNATHEERAILEGDLTVDWSSERDAENLPVVKRIDASHLAIKSRRGRPPFQPVLEQSFTPPQGSYFIDPLILYDLDGDGLSEIILASKNLIFHRRAEDRFEASPLCRYDPGLILTGVVADFDGDGAADFLCAKFEGLYLFKGSPQGTFDEPGRLVWSVSPHLKYAQVLTCGDIDGDGDLDVWLGQYKVPYKDGQMPAPYHDANDGYPAYLLLNDGRGNFTDATAAAGLEKKRWRRSYSASFADLDGDGDLDLLVVSDFAGVDLYRNDGHGHFEDVTRRWIKEPHAFGMAHALADFNADGRQDLLMIGMNSPTVDRLEHLHLARPGFEKHDTLRSQMTYGNRLFLAAGGGGFESAPFNGSIARSGWAWGCSAFDFDNDGFADVYIANGHESGKSVRDYEPEFWLHDIYVGDSRESVVKYAYFGKKIGSTRGQGQSYGGYEKNRLYWNHQGTSFVEIGHLMGVAMEEASRNVVADDLDGDGRVDLLVTTFEAWPEVKQTLRIYKNTLDDGGNWIGFRFREEGGGVSPVGAQVTLRYGGRSATRQIVTGDSYRSQHANTAHFGVGKAERVDGVEIRWANGRSLTLREPAVNRYHDIRVPAENGIRR